MLWDVLGCTKFDVVRFDFEDGSHRRDARHS